MLDLAMLNYYGARRYYFIVERSRTNERTNEGERERVRGGDGSGGRRKIFLLPEADRPTLARPNDRQLAIRTNRQTTATAKQ